jgi:RNA polymerase sigma factor (sigma-70 family)
VETDGALIERSVRGRPDAFVGVVQRHETAVHAYLARRAGQEAADDLLCEVWLRAFAARGGYDPARDNALPWLYGIARNVLKEHWRAGSRPVLPPPPDGVDPWDDVDTRLDAIAGARTVLAAIRALPEADRDVLLLVAWEELSPAEAALVLGIPQGTARSRLHRAREALRPVLGHDGGEDAWPPRRHVTNSRTR